MLLLAQVSVPMRLEATTGTWQYRKQQQQSLFWCDNRVVHNGRELMSAAQGCNAALAMISVPVLLKGPIGIWQHQQ
jgi:hypothetical protein